MKKLTKPGIFFVLAGLAIFIMITFKQNDKPHPFLNVEKTVTIKNLSIPVEVAETEKEKAQGLSGKKELFENTGMYFDYSQERQFARFWMKDMNFPIDIIWIDQGKIVGIQKNAPVPQGENIASFNSPQPITAVLEVNAGYSDKNKLKLGDEVKIE